MLCAPPARDGLFGCGTLRDGAGEPLRPGGLALTQELVDRADFRAGDTVADVGCGLGASTRLLRDRGVAAIGVDVVVPFDAGARGEAPPFVVADAARLPFADESLDGVLSECSLSLTADRALTLAEWRRTLRRGGRLALSDVYRRDGGGAGRIATREALCADVAAAGLRLDWFEDRSEALKSWAAQFIFAFGSLDRLWGGGCALESGSDGRARLGYALLIAVQSGDRAPAGG
ncbi:MAG: DVU_1556 family methyltransferase [Roseiarcus sp.]|jgi:SAM-dependent methyltransferase